MPNQLEIKTAKENLIFSGAQLLEVVDAIKKSNGEKLEPQVEWFKGVLVHYRNSMKYYEETLTEEQKITDAERIKTLKQNENYLSEFLYPLKK